MLEEDIRCKILATAGGSTLVVRSEGLVAAELGDVLGVYRLVDTHQARPLYKQDQGENYIYFRWPHDDGHLTNLLLQQWHWLLVRGHGGGAAARLAAPPGTRGRGLASRPGPGLAAQDRHSLEHRGHHAQGGGASRSVQTSQLATVNL